MTQGLNYKHLMQDTLARYPEGRTRSGLSVEDVVQLKIQNTYKTHLEIAQSRAGIMRADMAPVSWLLVWFSCAAKN